MEKLLGGRQTKDRKRFVKAYNISCGSNPANCSQIATRSLAEDVRVQCAALVKIRTYFLAQKVVWVGHVVALVFILLVLLFSRSFASAAIHPENGKRFFEQRGQHQSLAWLPDVV